LDKNIKIAVLASLPFTTLGAEALKNAV